jgi:hypothetical protein
MSIKVEVYKEKSIVIRGDTIPYKESIKALGGKWNASLTDQSSGEKFGGWIFPLSKKPEVMNWIDNREEMPVITPVLQTKSNYEDRLSSLEQKLDKIIELMSKLNSVPQTNVVETSKEVSYEDEYEEPIPTKRLLRK